MPVAMKFEGLDLIDYLPMSRASKINQLVHDRKYYIHAKLKPQQSINFRDIL